jgi:endoglucanase
MKTKKTAWFLLSIAALGFVVPIEASAPKHGWLKTSGGDILNEKGNIVQLRGMSFYWSNPSWRGIDYYNASTVTTMVNDWKCTVLRVAYDRDKGADLGWSQCQTVIKAAIDAGIYVIIDWHSSDAQTNQSAAVSFFTSQAQNYKSVPNVIFEPFNEPVTAGGATGGTQEDAIKTWAAIKPYLTAVTQAIRDQGASNLVILGTPYYSQFVNVASNDQPKDKNGKAFTNVAYVFHFYAASHGPNAHYLEAGKSAMEAEYLKGGLGKVPIFISEWGTTHQDGGQNGHTYIDEANTDWWFSNYVDKYHLSHCNWSISALEASSCFSGGTTPSASGTIAQRHIKNSGTDEFAPASSLGSEGPASDSVFTMPGYHPAKGFNRYFGGNINATDFSVLYNDRDNSVDVQNAGYTCVKVLTGATGDWISYFLKISSATKKMAVRWLAKDGAGTVDVYLKSGKVGSFAVSKNATWHTSIIDVNAAAGNDTLKFNFSGVTGNGFAIEWFQMAENIVSIRSPTFKRMLSPVAIVPALRGFDALLPGMHRFESYRLVGAIGKELSSGMIGRGQSALRFTRLPSGLWFLELKGGDGVKMFPVMVR